MTRRKISWVLGALAVAAGLAFLRPNPSSEEADTELQSPPRSERVGSEAPDGYTLSHLTLEDVRAELARYGRITVTFDSNDPDRQDRLRFERLLRRLGELEGDAALDEILNMRGKAHTHAIALAHALTGWFRANPEEAEAAFREMLGLDTRRSSNVNAITWRGKTVFNPWETFTVNHFISLVMEARTRIDPAAGRELLLETLWRRNINWGAGLAGYLDGLRGRNDWLEVREEFLTLIDQGQSQQTSPVSRDARYATFVHNREKDLDWIIARRWARDDLPAALKWYAKDRPHQSSPSERALELLGTLPPEQRSQVADWMAIHNGAVTADDTLPIAYVQVNHSRLPSPDLLQLLTVLPKESQRAAIVAHFASAERKGKGQLRYQTDHLLELLNTAQLSPEEHARWEKHISSGSNLEKP